MTLKTIRTWNDWIPDPHAVSDRGHPVGYAGWEYSCTVNLSCATATGDDGWCGPGNDAPAVDFLRSLIGNGECFADGTPCTDDGYGQPVDPNNVDPIA